MLPLFDKKYKEYVTFGFRVDDDGKLVSGDGIFVSKNAPEEVKQYFEELNNSLMRLLGKNAFVIL